MAKTKKQFEPRRKIPAWLFLVAGVVLIGAAAFGIWVVMQTPARTGSGIGPQLAVSQERIELGKVPFNQMVQAQFQIKNTGDQALTLDASDPVRAIEGC